MAGRPSKVANWLTEDGLSMLTHWKRNDLTDAQIAEKIGIKPPTLNDWKKKYPQISEALKKGLEYCIKDAEEALVSKFQKYEYKETQIETWEEDGKVVRTHKKVTNKIVMPDTAAIIFFLKAKAGWRDNAEVKAVNTISDYRRAELDEYYSKHKR